MENWWTHFPWGWLIAVIILYLIGYYEGRATGYRKRKKEEQKEKENQAPPEPQIITETVTQTVTVDDPGLLRIKMEDAGFTLDLDGTRVNPISLSPEQRKRLIEILGIMRPWLEGRVAPATPSASVPVSAPSPASGIAPVSQSSLLDRIQSKPAASPPPVQTPPPVSEVGQVSSAPPAPPPSPQPVAPKPATIAKEDRPAARAGSMVDQIDTILQAHLTGTPLEERGIFLAEAPDGGVIVYIGLTRYQGIEEVPDPEIKAVIRAATTEWEHKYTPGLK